MQKNDRSNLYGENNEAHNNLQFCDNRHYSHIISLLWHGYIPDFGTTAYHLGMRLLVGLLYNLIMKNQADYTKKWYQLHTTYCILIFRFIFCFSSHIHMWSHV